MSNPNNRSRSPSRRSARINQERETGRTASSATGWEAIAIAARAEQKLTHDCWTQCRRQVDGLFEQIRLLRDEKEKTKKELDETRAELNDIKQKVGDVCEHGGFMAVSICTKCKTGAPIVTIIQCDDNEN